MMVLRALAKANKPLFGVCSYGRSGSSFFMQILKAAGVSVIGDLPFEDRTTQASYLACLHVGFGRSVANSDAAAPAGFSESFRSDWYRSSIGLQHQNTALEIETDYEKFLADQGVLSSRGIAEKFIGFEVLRLMKAADAGKNIRPIFLVRDPRDIFISVKKFNEKRGFKGFNEGGNDLSLLDSICNFSRTQVNESRAGSGLLCYYEDFILRRSQSVCDLFRYLGVGHPTREFWGSLELGEAASRHMTSSSQAASLDRWKDEEFSQFRSLFQAKEKIIAEIGYL